MLTLKDTTTAPNQKYKKIVFNKLQLNWKGRFLLFLGVHTKISTQNMNIGKTIEQFLNF